MDLVGPMQTSSLSGKRYILVVIDDYSRFTWVLFLNHKSDTFDAFKKLCKRIQKEKGAYITSIRGDRGGEFSNEDFVSFCEKSGIKHQFSAPSLPQQNGVVERRNRSLVEMGTTLLKDRNLPYKFWTEMVNMTCYICNWCLVRPLIGKTSYELYHGKIPSILHFKIFGSKCFILNTKDQLHKFDSKSNEGIFLGYY